MSDIQDIEFFKDFDYYFNQGFKSKNARSHRLVIRQIIKAINNNDTNSNYFRLIGKLDQAYALLINDIQKLRNKNISCRRAKKIFNKYQRFLDRGMLFNVNNQTIQFSNGSTINFYNNDKS